MCINRGRTCKIRSDLSHVVGKAVLETAKAIPSTIYTYMALSGLQEMQERLGLSNQALSRFPVNHDMISSTWTIPATADTGSQFCQLR